MYVLFLIFHTCYLLWTHLQLMCLIYIIGTLVWHGGGFLCISDEEFSSCGAYIVFSCSYTSVYSSHILNIIYFVGIVYDITYTFPCEFSINFLSIHAYYNFLLGCLPDEEFIQTFADLLRNEFEPMRSQFAQYMCIVCSVYLHTHIYHYQQTL